MGFTTKYLAKCSLVLFQVSGVATFPGAQGEWS
jgi:hypothetical protein